MEKMVQHNKGRQLRMQCQQLGMGAPTDTRLVLMGMEGTGSAAGITPKVRSRAYEASWMRSTVWGRNRHSVTLPLGDSKMMQYWLSTT